MATDERAERPAAEAVAVHQQDDVRFGEKRAQRIERAERALELALARVDQGQAAVDVAEVGADLLGKVVQIERRGLAAGGGEAAQRKAGDRLAGDRQERLGDAIGERAEALAPAGGEHQRPQPGPTAERHSSGKTISGGASG
jgi:hypothetical protein